MKMTKQIVTNLEVLVVEEREKNAKLVNLFFFVFVDLKKGRRKFLVEEENQRIGREGLTVFCSVHFLIENTFRPTFLF